MPMPTSRRAGHKYMGDGRINHNSTVAVTHRSIKTISQGLRRPFWSAVAPQMGPPNAMHKPAMLTILPHMALPSIGFGATLRIK